jgi:hypothetical protein
MVPQAALLLRIAPQTARSPRVRNVQPLDLSDTYEKTIQMDMKTMTRAEMIDGISTTSALKEAPKRIASSSFLHAHTINTVLISSSIAEAVLLHPSKIFTGLSKSYFGLHVWQ